jgi:uncharacterized protein (UPF0216 family)
VSVPMQTKSLAELIQESNAAVREHEAAEAGLSKVNALLAALVLAEDHASDMSLPVEVRRMVQSHTDWTLIDLLKAKEQAMTKEVERLYDVCLAAAHALNDAPEEAA